MCFDCWKITLNWGQSEGMSMLTSYMLFIMVIYNVERGECQHRKFVFFLGGEGKGDYLYSHDDKSCTEIMRIATSVIFTGCFKS
jgi:hypothetical protein